MSETDHEMTKTEMRIIALSRIDDDWADPLEDSDAGG